MAKHESTAINDLIHVTQGRMPEPGGPDPADGLFVTKPPPPATFVPVAAYFDPGALTSPVPLASVPPPLPRRRAPNATPPVVPIHHDDDDDDEETQIDPNVMAKFAAATPSPLPFASPIAPQPILPHYAIPSPVPLPPAPQVMARGTDRTPRVAFHPLPGMPPAPSHVPAPVAAYPAATYPAAAYPAAAYPVAAYPVAAPPSRPTYEVLETHRVDALPAPALDAPSREWVSLAKKLVLPFVALVIVMTFVGRHFLAAKHDSAPPHREPAPVVMQVSAPPASAAVAAATAPVAAPAAAPAAASIADAAPPTVSAMGDKIEWKPRDVQPTLAAKTEPVEPAVVAQAEAEPEIEMDAVPVAKQPRTRRSSSSGKRPAPKQVAAALPAPKAEKRAKIETPAKPVKPAKAAKAAKVATSAEPTDDDPIAAAINAPAKSKSGAAKGTGPGRVTITSTPAALIYVDGRSLNKMTPQTLTLPEGPHKITLLELSSRKAKTSEIVVEAGASSQVAKKF